MVLAERLLKKLLSFDTIDLEDYIPNLRAYQHLVWKGDPTPHLVIDNFFSARYANELTAGLDAELSTRECTDVFDREKFSRMENYDAFSYLPSPSLSSPFRVFYSREWYTFFEKLSGRRFDENVMTTLHHHEINSETGYVHSDYAVYAFRYQPFTNQLNHWYHNSIYQPKSKNKEEFTTQKDVLWTRRCVVLIYFLDNETWREGDGGETGFFFNKTATEPILKIAPLHNRLLVFKIHPSSFHAFIKNVKRPRNTIIQWFHEPFDMPENLQRT